MFNPSLIPLSIGLEGYDAYKDMEAYIKKNFVKAAKEGNFFTTMTA